EVLDKLVAEAHALALTGIGSGSVDIRIDLDPAAVTVFVDRIQIQQVLFNLLRNAIEARGNIEPKRIIITARAATDGLVQLTVADNGPGVAAETALHLFEPFRSSTSGGMGMGLSICRDIVEVHGGRIWCEAVAGGGTAFHFTLMAGTQEHDHGR
ncbi:MAG: sensor histidine kinase, partial [Polymorphobacter sp.]